MEKIKIPKFLKIVLFVLLIICVFFFGRYYLNVSNFIIKKELLGNIIDFVGNILIALTSAGIAWFVSKREYATSKERERINAVKEKKGMLQLLKIENEFNLNNLESAYETEAPESKIEILKQLTTSVWEDLRFKIDLTYEELEDISICYYQIDITKRLIPYEIKNNPELIEELREVLNELNDMLNELIKQNEKSLN
ncbi:MAG: hypothetical protein SPG88_02450 [Enterococcus hirae]|uniref:hypothetical protein n=1 Tax=Enterococcus TaxID=1350 RepID=UPI0003F7CE3F|nr:MULTISPECIES: hypothetical protein [Enterococcus]KEI57781.1 hypothetical protein P744_0106325 [Enterococcus faecium UC10237]MCD4922288.1 hypothetical protein [Enterococcus faecium]MCD5025293.1 hypothetical protein [Enterococcus faecium]MCI5922013.1 hypothetical protein [Enterococcus hirae]MDV7801361.1 hypothetical protein [Enterococcus hirae]